ncbi:MAG: 50S ribosomal protein L23 [Candidatus Falkowbacteria bacterium]
MGLFNKKTEDKKQPAVKAAKVNDAKSGVKADAEVKSMKDLYSTTEAGKIKSTIKASEKKSVHGNAYKIIMKPLVTEKVSGLGALNKYVFAVAQNTNKIEVAKAIKEIYGIKPVGVNVIRMSGKKARYGRISGRRKDWKKSIITLPKGETIKVYEGV